VKIAPELTGRRLPGIPWGPAADRPGRTKPPIHGAGLLEAFLITALKARRSDEWPSEAE
jgi:hypothetical protein